MLNNFQKIKKLEAEVANLKSSVNELKILNDIALTTGKATDIDQILNLIVQKCVSVIEAEQGSIHLVTDNEIEPFKTIVRKDDSCNLKHSYHIGSNITGWVLLYKEPLIIENLSKDKRFNPCEEEKRDIRSVLCVPIWFEGAIIGIMMLINKKFQKHFSQNDLTLFTIISVQAGQLIKNLQLQRDYLHKIKESEKLQELDKLKTNFFTNISHEFKTPLTLILGPAQQIFEQTENAQIKDEAKLIQRNAKKLNRLANQLLDLARIEAGQMKLKTELQNMVACIKEITLSFQSFAESKKILLTFYSQQEKIPIYFDKDKVDKIISNLLSNALKFTPQNGHVKVEILLSGKEVEISVADNGIGMPHRQLDEIFERFYQIDSNTYKEYEGTGIGLSLTKELVDLHKGKISVVSEEGKGSTFSVILPLGKDHLFPDEISGEALSVKQIMFGNNYPEVDSNESIALHELNTNLPELDSLQEDDRQLLLIIEDNRDVRNYVIDILKGQFKVASAADGEEGLKKSFELIPDLIISDIMMPKMDGFQLCNKLKTDSRTSHIPIILLTAKTTLQDKIEGLETGADDYIIKPFEAEELKARIINILEQRKRIHEYFQKHGLFEIEESCVTPVDKKFLQKAAEIINEHIADTSFNLEIFAGELAVSRSLLHKKFTVLTGEPPGEFIKIFRLNKAVKLLENKFGNITEVAFEVGFNDPSYFAVCFKKQFGISPSQYHQNKFDY